MKNILTFLLGIIMLVSPVFAESQPLLPANFAEITNGSLAENTLLASDYGDIFIEFSKETKFVNSEEKTQFSGEILPPQSIELDIPKPRGMMEELVTFEMVSNSGADIAFLDKYDTLSRKNIFRESLLNPEGLKKSSWVKLIYLINDPLVKLPKLWEWQGEEDGWSQIGGNISDIDEDGEQRILSAILRRTGIYTVFDENPAPKNFADEYEIYPKREYTGLYFDEVYPETKPVALGFAEDSSFEDIETQNIAEFHSSGQPPLLDYDLDPKIPSTNISENSLLLQELQTKISEDSEIINNNPSLKRDIDDLIVLVNKKIVIEKAISSLTNELNTVSFAISRAESEEERSNLEKTFLNLQTNLYETKKEIPDDNQFLALKKNVDDFFAGIPPESLSANSFAEPEIDRSPPPLEDELYIPENAELTQSGGEESPNISWTFPVFLLFCFGLLGWGIVSAKKERN